MNQDRAVNKMLTSMRLMEEITEEQAGWLRPKLQQVWAAGYDHGREELAAHNKKPVERVNAQGKVLERFPSIKAARKAHKCNHSTIYRSITTGLPTKRTGKYWRYADD